MNTHIMKTFESKDTTLLARIKDGMIIGVRTGCTVAFGEDPRQQSQRVFTDRAYADMFLRKLADIDIKQSTQNDDAVARIQEIDGEPRLVSPSRRN